jgi:cytosine/adenosine deaminase-related metal-dependent hydrolase
MRALGWPEAGRLIPGATADFCTVSTDGPRLRGVTPDTALGHLVFAASAADVSHVVVGGRVVKEP